MTETTVAWHLAISDMRGHTLLGSADLQGAAQGIVWSLGS